MAGRRHEPRRRTGAVAERWEASVSPAPLCRALAAVALALLLLHGVLSVVHYRVDELPWLLLQLFDVDQENNLPTWYSAFLLLLTAGFLWLVSVPPDSGARAWTGAWRTLAVGFLLMSVDEVAGVHETINSIIVPSWAIAGGIAASVLGLAFIPFLLHLPRRTAALFALSGAIFLAGATGLEIVGNEMVGNRLRETLEYSMTALVEEGLEMGGVILFMYALLEYMQGRARQPIRAGIRVGPGKA